MSVITEVLSTIADLENRIGGMAIDMAGRSRMLYGRITSSMKQSRGCDSSLAEKAKNDFRM